MLRRHRKARAITPEHEGEIVGAERIADRGDDRGASHVHGLVAAPRNRRGRALDVGEPEQPVVGQRHVELGVGDLLEAREHRGARVETRNRRAILWLHRARYPLCASSNNNIRALDISLEIEIKPNWTGTRPSRTAATQLRLAEAADFARAAAAASALRLASARFPVGREPSPLTRAKAA